MTQDNVANPYSAPKSDVSDHHGDDGMDQTFTLNLLSKAGRIGRVRYIAYGMGLTLLMYLVIGLAVGLGAIGSSVGFVLAVTIGMLGVCFAFYAHLMLTIKRCHDMDVSGWLALLIFVPMGALVFLIAPGTNGANRYGRKTAPNSTWVVVCACGILPLIMLIGIVAAIAIPAYQGYVQRAQAVEIAPR